MIQLNAPLSPTENVQCPVPDGRADVRIDLCIAGAANFTASDDSDQTSQRLGHRVLTVRVAQLIDAAHTTRLLTLTHVAKRSHAGASPVRQRSSSVCSSPGITRQAPQHDTSVGSPSVQ